MDFVDKAIPQIMFNKVHIFNRLVLRLTKTIKSDIYQITEKCEIFMRGLFFFFCNQDKFFKIASCKFDL